MAIHSKHAARLKHPMVLLLIAALLAGAVAWAAYYYLQQREQAMKAEISASGKRKSVPLVSVVVPSADVRVNTLVDGATFVARDIEADLVYPDTVLAADFSSVQGQRLARPLLRGRPLRLTDLLAPEIHDVASVLPAGRRALTIEIDNLNSIAQTLRPNHHIDIFLLSKAPKPDPGPGGTAVDEQQLEQATLYMQNMVVLATGKEVFDVSSEQSAATSKMVRPGEVDNKERGYDSVTLLVTPAEAARLMVGQRMGTFRVALRGAKDQDAVALAPLRAGDLLPGGRRQRDQGIEFIVGGKGDKLLSQLPTLPSQETAVLRAMQAAAVAKAPTPAPSDQITISMPASGAGRPIPAFQKN